MHPIPQQLQQELDNVQTQVSSLYGLSDHLTRAMSPSTIAIMTSRQAALEQRLLTLRQVLSQHVAALTQDMSMMGKFNQAFEVNHIFSSDKKNKVCVF